jgi:sortase A
MAMRRVFKFGIVGGLLIVAAWQIGAAGYIHAKAWLAQHLIASAWARTLDGESRVRPWPWADAWPIARLRVPEQDVDLYVLSDATGRSLAFGPGLLSGSALPGRHGTAVIAAHRDTHFQFLRDAAPSAALQIQSDDGRWRAYQLTQRLVLDVRRDRLAVAGTGSTLTLLTCYPFDTVVPGGPLRLAVIAEPMVR